MWVRVCVISFLSICACFRRDVVVTKTSRLPCAAMVYSAVDTLLAIAFSLVARGTLEQFQSRLSAIYLLI